MVKKNNQGDTAEYEVKKNNLSYNLEDDVAYLTCKALSKNLDRKYCEKILVENGLDKIIDFDEFFST